MLSISLAKHIKTHLAPNPGQSQKKGPASCIPPLFFTLVSSDLRSDTPADISCHIALLEVMIEPTFYQYGFNLFLIRMSVEMWEFVFCGSYVCFI
jgi:hypothetical protein